MANAAREIVATIGDQTDVETTQQELADDRGISIKALVRPLVSAANFFKHADRDADQTLDFDESATEVALQLACHDFGRITVFQSASNSDRTVGRAPTACRRGAFCGFCIRRGRNLPSDFQRRALCNRMQQSPIFFCCARSGAERMPGKWAIVAMISRWLRRGALETFGNAMVVTHASQI